ncbi:MAG: hypothetical protein AB7V13_02750 [Pseudorhodoplanes sp.]
MNAETQHGKTKQATLKPVVALVFAGLLLGEVPAAAQNVKCRSNEVSVPDERQSGSNLCLKKSEWNRAKAICKRLGQSNTLQCLCQDGNAVGACGD